MAEASLPPPLTRRRFGETTRPDTWWIQPLAVFLGLSAFVVYATWAAFQGDHYRFGPYLSPFYSPDLFRAMPGWWPGWLRWSPAWLILWAPGGFRLTCYYYRGAYYKSFWADPPACTVGEPRSRYHGEQTFPLVLQNAHRYFLYLALVFLVILASDVWRALWFVDATTGRAAFGLGIGTLVLATNVTLLGGYTLGCHSLRHVVGGALDRLAGRPVRFTAYRCVSCLNRRHMVWAWLSLFWVAFSDVYVRLCSLGVWHDWRIF